LESNSIKTYTGIEKFNPSVIREHFPILNQEVNGKPLIYFDNAATTQKPDVVINAISDYYLNYNANIHRGIHSLAEKATEAYENSRRKAKDYINASSTDEVIFTYGTTDGINLAASSLSKAILNEGDEVIISAMEHHSNIVPWQMVCEERNAVLKVAPISESGELIYEEYVKLLSEKVKIVSIVHVSNSLGTINPVKRIIEDAHKVGAFVVIDGAQAAAHLDIDVKDLDCDLYAFSSHKMFGPTGVGILYGKRAVLDLMPPYRGGGEMIKEVTFKKTTYNDLPFKFEAGTPNIADVIGFGSAINYIESIDIKSVLEYEQGLLRYGVSKLSEVEGLRFIGTAKDKVSVISFIIDNIHPFDIGMMLDAGGVAVRTGHHCTQPLMDYFNIEGTVRASLSIYNTREEIDILAEKLKAIVKIKSK
jgi:cysteine desulfurase/selenocysteine lyase